MKRKRRSYRGKNFQRSSLRLPLCLCLLVTMLAIWTLRAEKPSATQEITQAEEESYENVWVVSVKDGIVTFMAEGVLRQLPAPGVGEINNTLADIETRNGCMVRIGLKQDTIRGRVLAVGADFIEIENYGRLPLAESFAVYQIYGELLQKDYRSILVGYDAQEFIVGEGKVCGAAIEKEINAVLIRVLLRGNQYEGDTHERISLRSPETMLVEYGEEQKRVEPETEISFTAENGDFEQGRVRVSTESGTGMITVTSLQRAQGNPSYYGSLEMTACDGRLTVVNEVELEKYLYFVVPSEMPASYGLEALKAQAVCARSYACRQIQANSLSARGAHVDDSSNYQVYNNYPAAAGCTQAVEETRGQIMTYHGEVIQAYYFSTSAGYTTDADIWHGAASLPYIQGRRVWKEDEQADFAAAILDWEYPAYDKDFPWYRWYVDFSMEDLQRCADAAGFSEMTGRVQTMEVSSRGKNGIAKAITLTGDKGSAIIETELEIRKLLNPSGLELHRKDGGVERDFAMLPSGFFLVREISDGQTHLGYRLEGGGFGHGVGMSQNAARAMAEQGMSYQEILAFFYRDIVLESAIGS